MMNKYTHDTERWLRSQASLYRASHNRDLAATFELCADDVKRLKMADDLNQQGAEEMRDEVARLKGENARLSEDIRNHESQWSDADNEIRILRDELYALKEAAGHAMMSWSCDCKAEKSKMFKRLARLCGEG